MSNLAPLPSSPSRSIARVASAPRMLEGEGFEVRRAIPSAGLPALGPFILLDHFGPVTYGPGEAKGAPNHPHRGFETLTYLLEGGGLHRDSLGNVSVIGAGEAQWMRAGSGIVHDEGADDALRTHGGPYEGVQLWINLPSDRKMSPPMYRAITKDMIPEWPIGSATLKLLAGRLGAVEGPVATWANPWLAFIVAPADQLLEIEPEAVELGLYVLAGAVSIDGQVVGEGQVATLTPGERLSMRAVRDSKLFVLGGDPLDAPLRRYGPFVMNTDAEIHRAIRDFQAGLFGVIPARSPSGP